jgi:AraC-like DNA-binding protein
MFLLISVLGILLAAILIFFNYRKNKSTIYLGVFFLLVCLYCLYQYIMLYSKSQVLVRILLFHISHTSFLLYLTGPMLYWYIRSVLTDNSRLKKSDLLHLIPALIMLAGNLLELGTPHSEQIQVAERVVLDPDFLKIYKTTILSEIFSVSALYISRPLLVLCYTLWSAGLFICYLIQKGKSSVLKRQHFMITWLCILLGFQSLLSFSHLLLIYKTFPLNESNLFYTLNTFQVMSLTGLAGLMIFPFFFPKILYGLPRMPALISVGNEKEPDQNSGIFKTHNHSFETEYLKGIGLKADRCMKESEPYLHPDFNLTELAVMIHVPVHHLAYYFREEKKTSFHNYRDRWRIDHAEKLIRDGKAAGMTLEAIGMLSGFSTRNTFFIAFKKTEGITPGVFAAHCNT